MTAPSMAEVILAHLADPSEADEAERDLADLIAQALAAAGFGHVASVERERDAANGALDVAPEILRLAEMSDQVGAWKARAEAAEAQVAAVRALADDWEAFLRLNRCPSCLHIPATDCDHGEGYHHALSDLRRTLDGEGGR